MRSRATSILTASLVLGLGATLVAACSPHDSPSTSPESASDVAVPAAGAPAVSSRDREGAPTFVWADRSQTAGRIRGVASDVARAHLVEHAAVLGISKRLARGSTLAGEHALPDGGNVLQFEQKISGIQVFRTRASVIMDRSNALIAIAGDPDLHLRILPQPGDLTLQHRASRCVQLALIGIEKYPISRGLGEILLTAGRRAALSEASLTYPACTTPTGANPGIGAARSGHIGGFLVGRTGRQQGDCRKARD